jgi:hypothetical protein
MPLGTLPSNLNEGLRELLQWLAFTFPFNATGQPAFLCPMAFPAQACRLGCKLLAVKMTRPELSQWPLNSRKRAHGRIRVHRLIDWRIRLPAENKNLSQAAGRWMRSSFFKARKKLSGLHLSPSTP